LVTSYNKASTIDRRGQSVECSASVTMVQEHLSSATSLNIKWNVTAKLNPLNTVRSC